MPEGGRTKQGGAGRDRRVGRDREGRETQEMTERIKPLFLLDCFSVDK